MSGSSNPQRFSTTELGPMFWLLVISSIGSILAEIVHPDPRVCFLVGFVTIICLAKFLGDATEVIGERIESRWASILNATFGNATELVLGCVGIHQGLFPLMKISIFGGVFGNLMLVGGAAVLLGGLKLPKGANLGISVTSAHMGSMVLWTCTAILLVPTVVDHFHAESGLGTLATVVAAIACLVAYVLYLLFSLFTHGQTFEELVNSKMDYNAEPKEAPGYGWSTMTWVGILAAIALAVGLESEFFVGVIEPAALSLGWPKLFVFFFPVALAGGIAEHWSGVSSAMNGKMAMATNIIVGSSAQLIMFVLPVFTLYALWLGQTASLSLEPLYAVPLLLSYFLWDKVSSDGSFNWAEGALLLVVATLTWGTMFFFG